MKLLCIILSFYAVLLSVMPCCTDDICTETTSEQSITKVTDSQDADCKACSPFYCCSSCVGFVMMPVTAQYATTVTTLAKQYPILATSAVKDIPLAIWQPPKLS
ncbi:MAG: hypothetical protein EOP46_19125 [Sphingobacteriaceae bacterium]|nr:MAG: hypothetical protein EOP46_19125 [Sphingobacteriaceae bacterium]